MAQFEQRIVLPKKTANYCAISSSGRTAQSKVPKQGRRGRYGRKVERRNYSNFGTPAWDHPWIVERRIDGECASLAALDLFFLGSVARGIPCLRCAAHAVRRGECCRIADIIAVGVGRAKMSAR